ncbi:MAG TPA: FecR domain-containing protein, partial [Opitutus sp.]|nr:FecR domain-containing protein [Opitutus sp.]
MRTFPKKCPSDDEAIEARAAAWLAQRDDGMSPEDEVAFATWCAADRRHAVAVARLESAWTALAQLRDYRPTARAHPDRDLLAPHSGARLLVFPKWVAAAAVAAAAIAVTLTWHWRSLPLAPALGTAQVYTTTVGGYQRLTLPDGSIVELNDSSEVRVRYTPDTRFVQLVGGQAHFTVAKNKTRPFIVETRGVAVRAVGTAFDVRLAQDQVEVLVTEGRVQLDRLQPPASRTAPAAAKPSLLDAGWRAVVPHERQLAVALEYLPPERIRETLSWQGPRLVFVETPLAEVVEQFNRRNRIRLSLGDDELAALPVGGSFRAENVESFVR